jgi:hypothetical protein
MEENSDAASQQDKTNGDSTLQPQPVETAGTKPPVQADIGEPASSHKETENPSIANHTGQADATEANKALADTLRNAERWMIGLTLLIFLATAANVIVYYCESESSTNIMKEVASKTGTVIDSMNTALDNSRDSLRKSFEMNKAALDSATAQSQAALDTSIETARTDQRAWVGLKRVLI